MRRIIVLGMLVAAATVGISAAGGAKSPSGDRAGSESRVGQSVDASAFAVFRRARGSSDAVPERLATSLPNDLAGMRDLQFEDSRLAATDGGDGVYLIPKGQRDVCMLGVFSDGTTSMACAPWRAAANPKTPLVAMTSRKSGVRTFGVIADKMSDTRIRRADGVKNVQPASGARTSSASEPVSAFIDVSERFPDELVWSSPSGTETMGFSGPPEP